MGNRILKETICSSENLDALTPFQETFFYRLIVNCDDYGRMDARPAILASKLYPLRREIPEKLIEETVQALAAADLIITYTVHGKPYLQMKTWKDHQRIRKSIPKHPAPEEGEITSCGELRQTAASCGKLPPTRAREESNPIQSNIESEYESNPRVNIARGRAHAREGATGSVPDDFEAFWELYPRKTGDTRMAYQEYVNALIDGVNPTLLTEAAKELAERTAPEDFRYLPSAEKWLRNKGWLEKPPKETAKPSTGKNAKYTTGADYKPPKPTVSPAQIRSLTDQI